MNDLPSRITLHPDIPHGKPTIRNLRYPVSLILDLLAAGMTNEEVLADYKDLENDDIRACLAFAAKLIEAVPIRPTAAESLAQRRALANASAEQASSAMDTLWEEKGWSAVTMGR